MFDPEKYKEGLFHETFEEFTAITNGRANLYRDSPAILRGLVAAKKLEDALEASCDLTITDATERDNIYKKLTDARAELRARLEEIPG